MSQKAAIMKIFNLKIYGGKASNQEKILSAEKMIICHKKAL